MDGDEATSPGPTMASSTWLQNALTPKSKGRGSWFTSTPHKVELPVAVEDDLPMLKLTHFTKKVMVCFEKVKLGASKTCQLCIENPFDYPQELVAEKFPYKKGFTIPEDRWEYDEMETRILPITWTPSEAGNVRELVTFKCDGAFRLQVILLGTAEEKLKAKPRRGTYLFKKTNGNVRKAPGKVANRPKPKRGSPTVSEIYQQPRPIQTSTALKQPKPAHQKLRTTVGKENIPRQKDTMLRDILKPNKMKLTMVATKVNNKSPDRSPLQERTSPFQSMDTSLAEITNGTEAGEPTKRGTLSVCEGMSPLLQTSFVFFGDDTSCIHDVSEVFNDSIEVHVAESDPSETVTKSHSSFDKPAENIVVNVKRLSKEAQATVAKERPSSMTPPMRSQSRRALFGSPEQDESNKDTNLGGDKTKQDSQPKACIDTATVIKSEGQTTECLDQEVAKRILFNETDAQLEGTQDSDALSCEIPSMEIIPDVTTAFEVSSSSSSVVSRPICAGEADLFPVHESAVTKKLISKRKSDPKKPETVSYKKQKTQLVSAVKKPVTKPRPLSSTRAQQQTDNKTKKPMAKVEPSNRGMTRTMMLRRAAAGVTAQVSKPKPAKAKRPVKGVPMAKLNLVKPNKTALPRHPMPYAAKNMFYDERWMEKQEQGFTRWLNYVLTPDDCPRDPSCKTTKIDAGALFVEAKNQVTVALAPSNEDLSLRAYTARRKLNRLRRSACLLFQSEPVVRVIQKVEYEVERGGLKIRTDRKIHADYGIKQKVLNMFLSYNPLWLRIGLETVFGEILPIQGNTDILGLSRFVVQRLLWNPDIAQKYAHPTVPGLYGQGHEQSLCQFTLKKFLLLVFFLDRAKLTRLIDHNPCLFCKDAEYKSSRSLLLEFSRDYLQGEGDLTKHLSYYGYVVSHTQTALDEFDFAVSKLSTDLRCGVRMARVVELLTKNWSLSRELRVPAISRLQKIHNTDVALKALKEHGIDVEGGGVSTRAIVDGHREKTLQLLWRIIFYFQVEVMLNEEQLREEIAFLKKNLKLQHDLTAVSSALAGTEDMLGLPRDRRQSMQPNNVYFKSKSLSLLLQWCNSVCHFYGLKVENFTVSFSDGRALCYLVHYYHPSLLPLDAIRQDTTQTQYQRTESPTNSDGDDSFDGTWANSYSPSTGKPGEYERLLANERHNYKMLYEKVKELGGIPMMIKSDEMSNTIPDEKVVIVYVSYLCARLLDLRTETRAARKIQMVWRAYQLRHKQAQRQRQIAAVIKIQTAVRDFLTRRRNARIMTTVITMQALWRGKMARRQTERLRFAKQYEQHNTAAIVIQKQVKGLLQKRRFQQLKRSTLVLQSIIRGHLVRQRLRKQHRAAVIIQSKYQAWKLMQQDRAHYVNLKAATILLQSVYRGRTARKEAQRERAARLIQSQWRGYHIRRGYSVKKQSAVRIQAWFRMSLVRREYLAIQRATLKLQHHVRAYLIRKQQKEAATMMQALVRGYLVRQHVKEMSRCAVCIQSTFRAYIMQKHYKQKKHAAETIQMYWRATLGARQEAKKYQISRGACITMQAVVRGFLIRQRVKKMHDAATCIQSNFRSHRGYNQYQAMKRSAKILQMYWRSALETKHQVQQYQITRGACITMQSVVRGFLVRQHMKMMNSCAVCIQSTFRAFIEKKHYQQKKLAAQTIQMYWRATVVARQDARKYQLSRGACITMQAVVRGFLIRQHVKKMHYAATCIQSNYRSHRDYNQYQTMKRSAKILQMYWRSALETKHQVQEYQITRGACITMQAVVRGFLIRQRVKKMHHAATCIQSNYRSQRDYNQYQAMKRSAKILQMYWRSALETKHQVQQYQITRGACIAMQSVVRGFLVRQHIKKMNSCAVCIQSTFRAHIGKKQYQQKKLATQTIQMYWRATVVARQDARKYQLSRGACITMQAVVRGFLIRQHVKKMHYAATCIQSNYRSHRDYNQYQTLKRSAKILQMYWRSALETKHQVQQYQITRGACITMQAVVRGFLIRQRVKKMHYAATCIQSNFRTHRDYNQYQTMKRSAKILQMYWRSALETKHQVQQYQITRGACITMQSVVRGFLVRQHIKKMNSSAVCIQSTFRAHIGKKHYQQKRLAAQTIQMYWRTTLVARQEASKYQISRGACITMQAVVRGFLVRQHVKKMHSAATCIQSNYRCHRDSAHYQTLKKSTIVLQTHWRSTLKSKQQVQQYQITRSATITIQSYVRGLIVRQQLKKQNTAAICIQANYRTHLALKSYHQTRKATTVLQKYWKATLLAKKQTEEYRITRDACITIQSHVRGYLLRQQMQRMHSAAICVQTNFRSYLASKKYQKLRHSTTVLQTYWRSTLIAKQQRQEYQVTRGAIITIQSWARGCRVRQEVKRMNVAATCIQSNFRAHRDLAAYRKTRQSALVIQQYWRATLLAREQRIEYQLTRGACITIQAWVRGLITRRDMKQMHSAATCLQSRFRGYQMHKRYQTLKNAAVVMQTHWRAVLFKRECHKRYTEMRNAAVTIQAVFRGRQGRCVAQREKSARTIQAAFRMHAARQWYLKQKKSAIVIQAKYRAHMAQKSYQRMKCSAIAIQQYFRSLLKTREVCALYTHTRNSIIMIQSTFRMFVARRTYLKKKMAAITIQADYRSYKACSEYKRQKRAAIVIQKHYRGLVITRQIKSNFDIVRESTVKIQSYYRMHVQQKQYLSLQHAATVAQAYARGKAAYLEYNSMKRAAVVIQTRYRATLLARQQRVSYQYTRGAVITIQSFVRGYQVRKHQCRVEEAVKVLQIYLRATLLSRNYQQEYQTKKRACVTIQAATRGYLLRRRVEKMTVAATCIQTNYRAHRDYCAYKKTKMAAICLQMYWRAMLVARKETRRYQISRGACITMQAVVRGFLVRQHIRKMHSAATCIQSNYRCHRDSAHYQTLKRSTIVLQTHWKSTLKSKQQMKQYQITRSATITIQSYVRGLIVRQQLKKQNTAAICIQANYRTHLALKSYHQTRKATIVLQKYWRATRLAKKQTEEYWVTRGACITIQAYVRGYLLRQHIKEMHSAATCIQTCFRSYHASKEYQILRHSTTVLQTYWRATLTAKQQRQEYQVTRGAVITIQSWARGCRVRQEVKRMNVAATCIQSNFRAHRDLAAYHKTRQSTLVIQQYLRATLLAREQRIEYQLTRGACITIQAWVRGLIARRHVEQMHSAATCLQSRFRGYQACKHYQSLKNAAVVMQTHWRAVLFKRECQKSYTEMRNAAVTIQAVFRGRQGRCLAQKERSARTIQAAFKMYLARQVYLQQKQSAIIIQSMYRAHTAQKAYQIMRCSAIVIQQYYRSLMATRKVHAEFTHTRDSIIKIQSTFRMFIQRKSYVKKRTAAIRIQAQYRSHTVHNQYKMQREATIVIQRHYRGVLSMRHVRAHFKKARVSAIMIQSCYRMHMQRKQYLRLQHAATIAQAYARGKAACLEYNRMKKAAVVIQERYRATLLARLQQVNYQLTRGAIVTIQSVFRGHQARTLVCQIRAAIMIQAVYRGHVQRLCYQSLRKSAILLQALVRGMQARELFVEKQRRWNAAVCIQRAHRTYVTRKEIEALRQARLILVHRFTAAAYHHMCAIKLQRYYRNRLIMERLKERLNSIVCVQRWWRAKLQHLRFKRLQRGTVLLQRAVRRHQAVRNSAAVKLQSYARVWLARQYVRKMKASSLRIQCLWRGYRVRAANKSKKVAAARARCLAANAAATEEKKLCNMTTSALDYLLQYKNLSYILEALMNLDVVTRLSPICCERLVEGQAVPVIYTLIRSCNRSQPCKEVIKYCVSILLNLVKYPKTAQAVFDEPESVPTILDLMQIYREKGTLIFCQTCLLLGTLSHDTDRAKAIHAMPKIKEKIASIHRLTERKHKMDTKRIDTRKRINSASNYLNSSRMNSSMISSTPKRRRVQPDWVLGRGKLRDIQDPMKAITFLMDSLSLLKK